jgi:hypothetical protein
MLKAAIVIIAVGKASHQLVLMSMMRLRPRPAKKIQTRVQE